MRDNVPPPSSRIKRLITLLLMNSVPFLPVRDDFHPKRNQARQKLATLPSTRFKDLSSDVFYELSRRYPEFREFVSPHQFGFLSSLSHNVTPGWYSRKIPRWISVTGPFERIGPSPGTTANQL